MEMKQRAVFLDRDGVINIKRPDHVKSWEEFEFLPGVLSALARLKLLGWPVVVVSNQAVIGRRLASQRVVDNIHVRMLSEVLQGGGRLDQIFYCPHHPNDGCNCRKPKPGLLLQAAQAMDLDLRNSFMIGDAESDIQAALEVGCWPILITAGHELACTKDLQERYLGQFQEARYLGEAVDWIFKKTSAFI
jgi:D-glycero-D-manno-heptose 1,7-bisphosphate phosphatase